MDNSIWKQVILGIDAAWSATQPSGVSLFGYDGKQWHCIAIAPSYQQFIELVSNEDINWNIKPKNGLPVLQTLLNTASSLAKGQLVNVISVDMPLSKVKIKNRRIADNEISREFGGLGCAVHSPNTIRPGIIADQFRYDSGLAGFELSVVNNFNSTKALIEVYPHTALLKLLNIGYRHPYKVSKSKKYWPNATLEERKSKLLSSMQLILNKLQIEITGIRLKLPSVTDVPSLSYLKRYEDVIDALVCGWVGIKYLQGQCIVYGDSNAAIWTPG